MKPQGITFRFLLSFSLLFSIFVLSGCTEDTKKKLKISIASVTRNEGHSGTTIYSFRVGLSKTAKKDVSIDWATADDTAEDETGNNDYESDSGTLVIPAGSNQGFIDITVNGDADIEPDEMFRVNISNPVNAVLKNSWGRGLIVNDDVPGLINISGTVTYDSIPDNASGLDYGSITPKPVRGAVIEALLASDESYIDSTDTDASGNYTLVVSGDTDVIIRVHARMHKVGTPGWDMQVVDNTASDALYVMDSASFNSGTVDVTGKDLHAATVWSGSAYTDRTGAPFVILDTVYDAVQLVLSADPNAEFPQLLLNWSELNTSTAGGNPDIGDIGTSYYDPAEGNLYILGDADSAASSDTDEYDTHVVAHEWGHYFEDKFSRADSPGGSHGSYDKLDPRLSFGEGWGNAVSAMITGDPVYVDTSGNDQGGGWDMDVEDNTLEDSNSGWWAELSLQSILFDLYDVDATDTDNDGIELGFTPIYNVLTGSQKTTDAFTTIYSFIEYLKIEAPASASAIDALVLSENIDGNGIWGTGENNNPGNANALPVYYQLVDGNPAVQVYCDDPYGSGNMLMVRRFFYFEITTSGTYTITADPVSSTSDPMIFVYSKGEDLDGVDDGYDGDTETLTRTYTPGFYTGEIIDWNLYFGASTNPETIDVTFD